MPSPVGHLLSGAAVYLAGTARERRSRLVLAITLFASIAPDFDFIPGILIGDMRAFHHGISHSFAVALVFGTLIFLVVRPVSRAVAARTSLLGTLAYSVHVLLDCVSVNEGTRGVPLFWPLSREEWGVSLYLFGHFQYRDISEGLLRSVVRAVNVLPLLREILVLGTLVIVLRRRDEIRRTLLSWWARKRTPDSGS